MAYLVLGDVWDCPETPILLNNWNLNEKNVL